MAELAKPPPLAATEPRVDLGASSALEKSIELMKSEILRRDQEPAHVLRTDEEYLALHQQLTLLLKLRRQRRQLAWERKVRPGSPGRRMPTG